MDYDIDYDWEFYEYLDKAEERLIEKGVPDLEMKRTISAIEHVFCSIENTSIYGIGQDVKSMIWYYKRKIKKILKGDFTPVDPFYEFIDALRELGYSEQESEEIIHGK